MNSKSNLHERHHNGKEEKEKVPLNVRGLHWSPASGFICGRGVGAGEGAGTGRWQSVPYSPSR